LKSRFEGAVLKVELLRFPPPDMLLRRSRSSISGGGKLLINTFETAPYKKVISY
jgi:hypothetical protein